MKFRSDFVTNSSSSSFIIAYKEFPKVDDNTIKKYPWVKTIADHLYEFIKYDESHYETEAAETIKNQDELDEYILHNFDWCCSYHGIPRTVEDILEFEGDDLQKQYHEMKEKLQQGYEIMIKQIGYSDTILTKLVEELSKSNNDIIIIDKD